MRKRPQLFIAASVLFFLAAFAFLALAFTSRDKTVGFMLFAVFIGFGVLYLGLYIRIKRKLEE